MVLLVAGHADRENFLERAVLRDVLRIEVCAVHRIIGHCLDLDINYTVIGHLLLLVEVGLVLDDNHVILDH